MRKRLFFSFWELSLELMEAVNHKFQVYSSLPLKKSIFLFVFFSEKGRVHLLVEQILSQIFVEAEW